MAYVSLEGIAVRCIKVVAKGIAATVHTARRGFPLCLGREPKRLVCLRTQLDTVGARLEPANPYHGRLRDPGQHLSEVVKRLAHALPA